MQCCNRSVMAGFLDRIYRIYRIEISWGISSSLEFELECGIGGFAKVEGRGLSVCVKIFGGGVDRRV